MKPDSKNFLQAAEFIQKCKDIKFAEDESSEVENPSEEDDSKCKMAELAQYVQYLNMSMESLYACMNEIRNDLFDHATNGHLPPFSTPSQMTEAIKTLGLDKDYNVQKRVIYASEGRRSVADLNFVPKSK